MQMLDAVINLKDNFSDTLATIDSNAKDFQRTMRDTGRDVWRAGANFERTGKTMTKGLTVPLLGMAAGAVKVGMEFESGMSQVAATMGITVEEIESGSESFEKLKEAAREMGKTTQYSSAEASEALNYLALAGYDAEKSVEMLPKVLNLAAAGGLELGYAADIVTDSMSALELSTGEADRFIDEMAKTAQKSNTDVAQLGEAMLVVGANGRELANGTKELNTAIGLLGNAGIKGTEGGTKLRNIIMAMTPTTDKAAEAFKQLEVNSYDADTGALRPLNETLLDMSKSMEGMDSKEKTELMSQIFNKQDLAAASTLLASVTQSTGDLDFALSQMGISTKDLGINLDDMIPIMESMGTEQEAVNYIMDQFGTTTGDAQAIYEGLMGVMGDESAWEELENHIENAEGTAQEMADTLMHNLKGAFIKIKSALSGFGETIYDVIKPSLETAAGYVQNLIDKLNSLTPEQIERMVEIAKKVALMGPALVIIGKLVKGIGKVGLKISDVARSINKAGGVIGLLTGPAAMAIGVVLGLAAAAYLVYKNWDKIKPVIDKVRDAFNEFVENNQDKIDWVKDKFGELATTIKEKMTEAWEIFQIAKEKVSEFAEYISGPVETAKGIFIDLSETVWEKIQGLAELFVPLKESFSDLFSSLRDVFEIFKEDLGELFAGLGALFDLVVPYLLPIMAFIGGTFIGGLIVQFMTLLNVVVVVIEGVTGVLDGLLQILTGVIDFVVGVFTGDWERAWDGVKTIFDGVVQLITSIWQTFVGFVTAPVSAVIDVLDSVFHDKVAGVKKAWQSVIDFMRNPIQGTVNLVKKGWNKLTGIGNNYKGTDNWRGGPTWVHEKGAEIIDLPTGTRIYPHAKSLEMAKQEGIDSVRRSVERVRTIIQPATRTAPSHTPIFSSIGNNYMGTDNWRGGPTWVHEKGAEIIDLPTGTRIYPHAKSLEMAKQEGIDSARRSVERVRTIIQPATRTAPSHTPVFSSIANNYMGTDNWRGGPTWIHEKGPEIIDLPQGTRIYPHAKSLEMAKQQGMDSVRRNAEQVRTIVQPATRTAPSHAPLFSSIGRWIKQKAISANDARRPIDSGTPVRSKGPKKKELRTILVEKLAETIVVREEADIDKLMEALVKELEEAELNMA